MLTVDSQHVGANVVLLGEQARAGGLSLQRRSGSPSGCASCCAEARLGGIPLSALAVDGYCGTQQGVVVCTPLGVILRADTASAGYGKGVCNPHWVVIAPFGSS